MKKVICFFILILFFLKPKKKEDEVYNTSIFKKKIEKNEVYYINDFLKDFKFFKIYITDMVKNPINFIMFLTIISLFYTYLVYVMFAAVILIMWPKRLYIKKDNLFTVMMFKLPYLITRFIKKIGLSFFNKKERNYSLIVNRIVMGGFLGFSIKSIQISNDLSEIISTNIKEKNFLKTGEELNKYIEKNIVEKIKIIEKDLDLDEKILEIVEITKKRVYKQKIENITFMFKDKHIEIRCEERDIKKSIRFIEVKKKALQIKNDNVITNKPIIVMNRKRLITFEITFENYDSYIMSEKVFAIKNGNTFSVGETNEIGDYEFFYNNNLENKEIMLYRDDVFKNINEYGVGDVLVMKKRNFITIKSKWESKFYAIEVWAFYTEKQDENRRSWLKCSETFEITRSSKKTLVELINKNKSEIVEIYVEYDSETSKEEFKKIIFVREKNERKEEAFEKAINNIKR